MTNLRELYFEMHEFTENWYLNDGKGFTPQMVIELLEEYKKTLGELIGIE